MVLGKLLDRRRSFFLADHPTAGCMADRPAFYGDHIPGFCRHSWVDLFLGDTLGDRGADVWSGDALPGYVAGEFGAAWFYFCFWGAGAFHLLQFVPTPGKTTLHELLTTSWGRIVLGGVVLCLLGIYICGRAGVLKEKELPEEKKKESIRNSILSRGSSSVPSPGFSAPVSTMALKRERRWPKWLIILEVIESGRYYGIFVSEQCHLYRIALGWAYH